jgi:hypothetical protein
MLDSVDSMSVGKFDVAMLQEKDAIRFLIESRDRLNVTLQESENADGLQQALNQFFRQQQTKLRNKPKQSKDEQEKAKDLIDRLAQLATQESMVAAQLEAMGTNGKREPDEPPRDPSKEQNGATPADAKPTPAPGTGSQEKASETESDPESEAGAGPGRISREEIVKKQQEIASDAAEVRKDLEQMRQATALARKRMAAATESAEAA